MIGSKIVKAAALVALALAATPAVVLAQPAQKSANQCFLSRDVNGFQAPNEHTVYIRVGVKDLYRLDLMSDCSGLTFRQALGFESTPGTPWICSPLDATIVYRDTGIPQRCPVTAIHKLTPEEAAALPKRDRP
jgi:hypothetical protein